MKIAVILGSFSIGSRPLDFWFSNIWISTRGLTGTDLATVMISQELEHRGHDVHLFTVHAEPHNKPASWQNIKLYNYDERLSIIDDSFDAIISFNEPNAFMGLTEKPIRICWNMLNDFHFSTPGFDNYVDQWLGVCEMHTAYLKNQLPESKSEKWATLHLGCDPNWYEDKRVPGRIIWASSADRGLHWLLQCFPQIKAAVPEAHLKIFYHFNYGNIANIEPNSRIDHPHIVEMGQRIRYMKYAIEKLKPLGVEHVGSVSREEIRKQFSEASVLGFSCDTVAFSEGFSVTTLEAHASFTVPVITDKDCLGSIYNDSGAIVIKDPIKNHLPEFAAAIIKSLNDKEFADSVIEKCRKFANEHSWRECAEKMENIIKSHPKFK